MRLTLLRYSVLPSLCFLAFCYDMTEEEKKWLTTPSKTFELITPPMSLLLYVSKIPVRNKGFDSIASIFIALEINCSSGHIVLYLP